MLKDKDIDAVILAGGDYPAAPRPLHILLQAPMVVCCDGGADRGGNPEVVGTRSGAPAPISA